MRRPRYRWIAPPVIAGLLACAYVWALATPRVEQTAALPPSGGKLWSFGFVGDTQLGEGIVDVVFKKFEHAGVDFVLHLGDIVDDAASDEQWAYVLGEARRHGVRLRPVVGNHDRLVGTSDRGETRFREFFPGLPDTFYRFSHRGLTFVMLNSERSLNPWSEQGRFLAKELATLANPAVVCLHRPVFTCGRRDLANQFLRRLWLHARLVDTSARLVLSGHHHYYDRTKLLDGITYVVSGGGSRKLYPAADADRTTAAFQAGSNHFGLVDVYADRLEVRVIELGGKVIDRFAVELVSPGAGCEAAGQRLRSPVSNPPYTNGIGAPRVPRLLDPSMPDHDSLAHFSQRPGAVGRTDGIGGVCGLYAAGSGGHGRGTARQGGAGQPDLRHDVARGRTSR